MSDLKNLKCLLPDTEALLLKMIETCDFLDKYVLVVGSALSMHLCHRKSKDLTLCDFISLCPCRCDEKCLPYRSTK